MYQPCEKAKQKGRRTVSSKITLDKEKTTPDSFNKLEQPGVEIK
jgi:hypothetical protein